MSANVAWTVNDPDKTITDFEVKLFKGAGINGTMPPSSSAMVCVLAKVTVYYVLEIKTLLRTGCSLVLPQQQASLI